MELTARPKTKELVKLQKQKSIFEDWILNNPSGATRKTYLSVLKSFESFLKLHEITLSNIKQINRKLVIAYRDHLQNKTLSNKTINLHLSCLSSVIDWFIYENEFGNKENPVSRIKRPPSDLKKIKHHLKDTEIERIVATFTEKQFHLKTAFVLMSSTAQRGSSILNLKKSDVLYLEDRMVLSLKIKNGKQRLLPVPMMAERLLKELIKTKKDDEYLFVGRGQTNKPISLWSFNKTLKVKSKKAKIKKEISSHTMRRSLLNKLILKGVSIDQIARSISFHSHYQSLESYRSNEDYELKNNPLLKLDWNSNPERDNWSTPRALIERLEKEFRKFDLDVCASEKNKVCERYFDKETNGLEQNWSGFVWCNPPYSNKLEWIEKAHLEAQKGSRVVILLPAFTETHFFRELKAKSDWLLFLNGRLVFNEQTQRDTAKFSSVVAFFNIKPTEMKDLGWIVKNEIFENPILKEEVKFVLKKSIKPKFEPKEFKSIDLFSGAGLLSLGLEEAGFESILAIDNDPMAINTYNKNLRRVGKVLDIKKLNQEKLISYIGDREIDLICGGSPCQSFSTLNQNPDQDKNKLVLEFGRVVDLARPKLFLLENVPNILERGEGILNELKNQLSNQYEFYGEVLNASHYGVAQVRKRFFLVGKHKSLKGDFSFPKPDLVNRKTVFDVIGDLPRPPEDFSSHPEIFNHQKFDLSELNEKRLSFVPEGGGWKNIPYHLLTDQKQDLSKEQGFDNVYGRLSFNEPAPTITTAFSSITRGRFAHPKENRAITTREASRLQSVPDWFQFLGNNTEVSRQVGNGVPVLLAKAIGSELTRLLTHR